MRSFLLQVAAVTLINIKSIPQRFWLSLSTVVAVALVVVVLLSFLAMANGFQRTLTSSGADDVAIVLRGGSQAEINSTVSRDQVRLIEDGARHRPQRRRQAAGVGRTLPGRRRRQALEPDQGQPALARHRPGGAAVRKGIAIVEGRMFNPGANEIVVGKALLREFQGFEIGQTVAFATSRWTVVGIFEADGSVFESEIWADLPVVQSLFNRNNIFQTVRARLQSPAALERLEALRRRRPAPEARRQVGGRLFCRSGVADLRPDPEARLAAWPSPWRSARWRAHSTPCTARWRRARWRSPRCAPSASAAFRPSSAPWSESLILAALGGVIGAVATYLVFDGFQASTLGASFTQVVFSFKLSPALIVQGVILALAVGLAGGLFPAIRAARMPIVAGLNS